MLKVSSNVKMIIIYPSSPNQQGRDSETAAFLDLNRRRGRMTIMNCSLNVSPSSSELYFRHGLPEIQVSCKSGTIKGLRAIIPLFTIDFLRVENLQYLQWTKCSRRKEEKVNKKWRRGLFRVFLSR